MAVKYVFVTGGVVSGLGKGITAASLGRLLKARGFKVTMQKFDPYINIDPGTMNPIQHGEVFVTDDGTETDLDLGHYERFIDESLDINSNVTTGKIYWSVLQKERHGDFGGGTVQVIPHITNEIKSRFYRAKSPDEDRIAIIEVGGTVGDIESQPFLESIRQFQHDVGHENAILIHVTLIPYLKASGEMKTKPTQASVKELQAMGIQPDVLVCRSEYPLTDELRAKIALFCNVPVSHVLQNLDVEYLYEAPLAMEREKLADVVLESLRLENRKPDLTEWTQMVNDLRNPESTVNIAMVGKYTQLHDAYLSVVEALKHGGISCKAKVEIIWIDSEELNEKNLDQMLHKVDGILVPGGFGNRGTEGMILAAQYARVHKIPYLGICLGMQMAIVEFAIAFILGTRLSVPPVVLEPAWMGTMGRISKSGADLHGTGYLAWCRMELRCLRTNSRCHHLLRDEDHSISPQTESPIGKPLICHTIRRKDLPTFCRISDILPGKFYGRSVPLHQPPLLRRTLQLEGNEHRNAGPQQHCGRKRTRTDIGLRIFHVQA